MRRAHFPHAFGLLTLLAGLAASAASAESRDYAELLRRFDVAVVDHIYDPRELRSPAYVTFRQAFGERVAGARDDAEVLAAFRATWKGRPFSHFDLKLSANDAAGTTEALHSEGAGERNAILSYPAEGAALLKVKTFLGDAVGLQLAEAMTELRRRNPRVLIVDLRDNPGGSIAAVVLIQALLNQPEKIGYFINGAWWRSHDAPPVQSEIVAMPPLRSADPAAFAQDMADGVAVIELQASSEPFRGRVYILTSRRTASIAELTTAALKGAGVATVIGETTAGEMLSGEFADVAEGFQLFMPMADY
jgi:hypothetical protein